MKTYNEISQDILARRDEYLIKQKTKRQIALRVTVATCCLCLVTVLGIVTFNAGKTPPAIEAGIVDSECTEFQFANKADLKDNTNTSDVVSSGMSQSDPNTDKPNYAINVPKEVIPEVDEGVAADMIGLIVYKGNIYTQGNIYTKDSTTSTLIGEYIGHATGTISEWSTQDDYAKELASTYTGDVYTVNGYDPDFRICIVWDNNIQFMEHLNGIGITTGKDVYSKRLHIDNGITSVEYLNYQEYISGFDSGINAEPKPLELTDDELDSFINAINEGTFADNGNGYLFNDYNNLSYIYLHLKDGTVVTLLLKDDGNVFYHDSFSFYYSVNIPQNVLSSIVSKCG
ncbi:MAG: hypothetical protein ACI4II_04475 [Acutalibacteraceae bacterium]